MAKKKKTTKQAQAKKSVAEPSTIVIDEKTVNKIILESHSKPIPEKQRQEPKVSIKLIPNEPFDSTQETFGEDPSTYCVSFQFTIPNLISYIRNEKPMVSTSDCFSNEETKYWRIVVSHNYDERTKQSSNQEIFMSLFIRYECDELRDPFHYVIIQIDFGNDVNHAYRFTTFPLLFDINSNSYKFGNVISLHNIFNDRSKLLKDGSLSFTIQIKPAPISTLSPETQFILYSRKNDIQAVKHFIEQGIDVNCTSSFFSQKPNSFMDHATALITASNSHANDVVQLLLPIADIFCTNANLENALHRACWSNNIEIVDCLLQNKCPIDKQNVAGITPLMIGCIMGYKDLVSLLIKRQANCNCTDNDGNTALHFACSRNHEEIVSLLIQAGINIQCCNHNNRLAIDCTDNRDIQIMIMTKNQLHSLDLSPTSPFACKTSFQLSGKCLSSLFNLGINIMKFVASGTDHFPIYPFEYLLPVERLTLIQKLNDCVIQQKCAFELNYLNESLFFACIFVLTKGMLSNPDGVHEVPEGEIRLRNMVLNTYEEIYGESLLDRGIAPATSSSSVYTTIIDLILLSRIKDYSIKRELFLNEPECMSLYNLTQHYPSIDESYFATLPMTRIDELYLRPLSKHQLSVQQFESSCKEILFNIVSYLASPKPVKPITAYSISIEATVVHTQLQFIQKREINPYQLHNPTFDYTSNIYGHNFQTVNELNDNEFKQFWELLSIKKKHIILSIPIKDVELQARESIYWFIFRYALQHWDDLMLNTSVFGFERDAETISVSENKITNELLNRIITYASIYDKTMLPTLSSPSNIFNESFTSSIPDNLSSPESRMQLFISERFYIFLSWLFCDNICREFKYHKDEEEANRAAAMVLNENLNEMENTTKSKKKKNKKNKKKEIVVIEKEPEERIENNSTENFYSMNEILKQIDKEIQQVKEAKKQQQSSKPQQEEQEKKEKHIHNEAIRIIRFLQGEKREKADVVMTVEKKERKDHSIQSLHSLLHSSNQLFPPFVHTEYSQPSTYPSQCSFATILPTLSSFQQPIPSYNLPTPLPGSNENKSEVTQTLSFTTMPTMGYELPGTVTPSQLLQYTLKQQLDESNFTVSNNEGKLSNSTINQTNSSTSFANGNLRATTPRTFNYGLNEMGKADGNQTPTTPGRNTNSFYPSSSNRYYMSPNHPY